MAGGAGVISGLNNISPELFVQAIQTWQGNDVNQLNNIQREISKFSAIYSIGNNFITTIKTTVSRKFQYSGKVSRNFAGELTEQKRQVIDLLFYIK
ncbi:hypothetical protein ACSZND_15840 [Aeromonas hydrophila]|uniref:hypothetical protein n=1 Tax=Aeromonas TaxID=642 RepID=UPI001958A52E|nr:MULTISPECIES: hypothetical protein [Aeromonas]MCX4104848.1 hypothetical protein [Aeromonas hydrophila]